MFRSSKLTRKAIFHQGHRMNMHALLQHPAGFSRHTIINKCSSPRPSLSNIIRNGMGSSYLCSPPTIGGQVWKQCGRAYQSNRMNRRGVPAMYRQPDEQEKNTNKSSIKNDSGIYHSRKPRAKRMKKEFTALIRAEDHLKGLMEEYEKQFGLKLEFSSGGKNDKYASVVDRKKSIEKSMLESNIGLPILIQTEKPYSKLCLKLRQLIVAWSSIRTDYDRSVLPSLLEAMQEISNRDQVINNPAPAEIAYFHLKQLEMLRKQRADLIEIAMEKHEISEPGGVVSWVTKKVTTLLKGVEGRKGDSQYNGPLSPLDLLKAHLSPDYTADQQLYGEVMKSFVYWRDIHFPSQVTENVNNANKDQIESRDTRRRRRDRILHPTPTSAVMLADRLDSIASTMDHNFMSGNPNCRPLLINYNFLLKYLSFSPSKHHAMRASELLRSIEGVKRDKSDCQGIKRHPSDNSAITSTYTPTLNTYSKVLKTFRNLAGNRSESRENRRWATLQAEKILFELHEKETNLLSYNSISLHQESDIEPKGKVANVIPNISGSNMPLDLVLSSLHAAGHVIVPDMCDRVDKVMELIMGKEEYLQWIGEMETPATPSQLMSSTFQPDMRIHHMLIIIFSSSRNPSKLARAKVLMKSVEEYHKSLAKEGEYNTDLQKKPNLPHLWPTYRAYNSFLAGLNSLSRLKLRRALKKKRAVENSSEYRTLECNAEFAMSLLDSMIQRHGSLPDIETFHYIMRLWSVSGSIHAGEKGEELLSRMEVHHACKFGERCDLLYPNHLSYEIALDCWATSASAMEPGAARRALLLLDRMESQCSEGRESQSTICEEDHRIIYNDTLSFKTKASFVHSAAIHVCTATRLNSDKDDAFRIAFDVYNRMTEHGIVPTQFTYRNLLYCCNFLPQSAQRRRLELSRIVFEAACENGCVDARVLAALKQVNFQLRKVYEPLPQHSVALCELKRSFV